MLQKKVQPKLLPTSKLKLSDIFVALSAALDMGKASFSSHSRKTAYIALKLSQELNLFKTELNKTVLAALIHDIGLYDEGEKIEQGQNFDLYALDNFNPHDHCERGYSLLKSIGFLPNLQEIILHHHDHWQDNGPGFLNRENIPLPSRIIFLADRINSLINDQEYILFQKEKIIDKICSVSGIFFDPQLVAAFENIAVSDSFWLDISTDLNVKELKKWGANTEIELSIYELEQIINVFANIIDLKSPFTTRHSTGVATFAAMIAHQLGYSKKEQQVIRISGLVHDLGKMIIPDEILEKKSGLTDKEYKIIKQHPYYTYNILNQIEGMDGIARCAAFHHEKQDGSGYPFSLKGESLTQVNKIMTVSDIFQALTEERPYRPSYSIEKAIEIEKKMVQENKLDPELVNVLEQTI